MNNIIFMDKQTAEEDESVITYKSLSEVEFMVSPESIKSVAKKIEKHYKVK